MSAQPEPKRSFDTLTEDEARTLFALAFGYAPTDQVLKMCGVFNTFAVSDGVRTLWLSPDGSISAYDKQGASQTFNVRKLIENIDAMGVGFGPEYGPELFLMR